MGREAKSMEQWESGGPAGKAAAGLKKLYGLLKGEKRLRLLLALGLAGILLIALSGLLPEKDAPEPVSEADTQAYERRYQEQVTELVGQIRGAGKAHVVVTLESGVEYVYAREESRSTDRSEGASQSARNTVDQKTILVEDANGRKTARLRKTREPEVRGVVVVCEGGGNPITVMQITEAVKTALGIPSTRVCVAPLSDSD